MFRMCLSLLKKIAVFCAIFIVSVNLVAQTENNIPSKDVFLVVDVSKSMIGLGGMHDSRNIFNIVKDQLYEAIDNLEIGDSGTLIHFGEETVFYPTVDIGSQADKATLKEQLDSVKARSNWTYTAQMIRDLSDYMNKLQQKNPSRNQLAMIFSDAIDDPPPVNSSDQYKLGNGDHRTSACNGSIEQSSGFVDNQRFVYFFSINQNEVSKALANQIVDCFPNINIKQVLDPDYQLQRALEKSRLDAQMNLIPSIEIPQDLTVKNITIKAGESGFVNFEVIANRRASGKALVVVVDEGPDQKLFSDLPKEFILAEGPNNISLKLTIPDRAKGDYNRIINFTSRSNEEAFFFLPEGEAQILLNISATPLNIKERLRLPEYWIPLAIIFLALLYGLYQVIKYITFRPLLKLYYWRADNRSQFRAAKSKTDLFINLQDADINVTTDGQNVKTLDESQYNLKYVLDLTKFDSDHKILITSDSTEVSETDAYAIKLEGIRKSDEILFTKMNKGRDSKIKVDPKSLLRLRNKKGFRGYFAKNKSSFRVGQYNFYIETNLN